MNTDRRIACTDLGLFLPLAVPGISGWIVSLLLSANEALGLPGSAEADALTLLMVNLLGLFGATFALIRIRGFAVPLRAYAPAIKGAAALLIVVAVLRGAPALLGLIALADAIAALELLIARRRSPAAPRL